MRICVLDDVYDSPAWEAAPDDWRVDPTPFMKAHDFDVVGLTKETAILKLTQLSLEGYDVFFNLLAGAWDEESPGIEVVQALERLNVPFTGATSEFFEPSRDALWAGHLEAYRIAPDGAILDAAGDPAIDPNTGLLVEPREVKSPRELLDLNVCDIAMGSEVRTRQE